MGRHNDAADDDTSTDAEPETDALDSDASPQRSAKADAFWEKVGVEPVEIALPKGVGLTLRAYRMSDEIGSDEPDDEATEAESEPEPTKPAKPAGKKSKAAKADDEDEDTEPAEDEDVLDVEDVEDEDEEAEEPEEVVEEIPVFLTSRGTLPLFETADALVAYVKSHEDTDLAAIDSWDDLVKGIKAEYVVATEDDTYELDLVVKNLRGGHDSWDAELIVGAGELARDLGYALRLPSVMSTLKDGTPLDNLDNALRAIVDGGIRAMFARRKARKVGAQQTSLAWRGIINKIGESVDWRN